MFLTPIVAIVYGNLNSRVASTFSYLIFALQNQPVGSLIAEGSGQDPIT